MKKRNIKELVLWAPPSVFSALFDQGGEGSCQLLLHPRADMAQVGEYIAFLESNLYSVKTSFHTVLLSSGYFYTIFHLFPHRLPLSVIESNFIDYFAIVDESDRILDYNNNFYMKFHESKNRNNLFKMPFSEFLASGEWEGMRKRSSEVKEYLLALDRETASHWQAAHWDDLSVKGAAAWTFDPRGRWSVRGDTLYGRSDTLFSYAISNTEVPQDNSDIRIAFEVRSTEALRFYGFLCGRHSGFYSTPDSSGYLLGLRSAPELGEAIALIKRTGLEMVSEPVSIPEPCRWHEAVLEKVGGLVSLYLGNARVCQYMDLLPVSDPAFTAVGVACGANTEFRNFRIYRRWSRFDPQKFPANPADVRLAGIPDEIYEVTIQQRRQRGIVDKIIRLRDVTRTRREEERLRRALEERQMLLTENVALKNAPRPDAPVLVGGGVAMMRILSLVRSVAPTEVPVLLTGETGTGKDLVARLIHDQSGRGEKAFVKVDCASLPENLLESELFGHEKGAFTGAMERRIGRFEAAGQGTIFLDEIGNLSLSVQAKLLRVLQDRRFERVGGNEVIRSEARVLSATNADLSALIRSGRFREDLYYRINAMPLHIPALRERPEDIPLLVHHWLKEICRRNGREMLVLEPAAMSLLMGYPWPGNVRELINTLEYAVLLNNGGAIGPGNLPPLVRTVRVRPREMRATDKRVKKRRPVEISAKSFAAVWKKTNGSVARVARHFGICRPSVYRLIKKFGPL